MLKIDLQDVLTIKEEILSDLEDIDDLFKIIIFNEILWCIIAYNIEKFIWWVEFLMKYF